MDTPAPTYTIENVFGSNLKQKMTLGGKVQPEKVAENPGPGQYDSNYHYIKKRSISVINMQKQMGEVRHGFLETGKSAAPSKLYDTLRPFGKDTNCRVNFNHGCKFPKEKVNTNPAPGQYDHSKLDQIKPAQKPFTISRMARDTGEHYQK